MKNFTKSLLSFALTVMLGSWTTIAFAQPANDDCASAVLLTSTVNTGACTVTSGTTVAATQSIPGDCGGNADDDVWYRFVAASPDETITVSNPVGFTGITIDARSGACTGTSIGCILTTAPAVLNLTQLTVGATYLVRVYSGAVATGTFDICVQHPAPPVNDNCAGAINLTPTAGTFTNPGAQTSLGATQTLAACAAPVSSIIQDVWYSFTTDADGGSATIVVTPTDGLGDPVIQAISGACGSGGLGCANTAGAGAAETLVQGGYAANTTYFFRIYGQNTASFPFTISLTGPAVTPVANDECVNAILLTSTVAPGCVTTAGTTFTATRSQADAACLGGGEDDVWYSFVAASAQENITISNVLPAAPGSAIVVEVFTACGGTSIACGFAATLALTQLIEGNTYYVRVYTSITGANNKTFDICVQHPAPPANDECATATNLTPTAGVFTNPGAQTNSGGTRSLAGSTCATSNTAATVIQDVWYSFTTDADGGVAVIAVDATNVTGDPVIHLFSTCATSISCSDATGAGGTETLTSGTLPANTTYRFRVYGQNTANFPFTVSVTGTALMPPANDECAGALPIAISPASGCSYTAVNTATATQSTPNPTCTTTGNDDDVWYTFTPSVTGPLLISYINLVGTATIVNYEFYTGTCGALVAVAGTCGGIGAAGGADDNETTVSVTAGTPYRMRVWAAGVGTTAAFDLCLRIPPAVPVEDECATATLLVSNTTCMNTAGTTVSATSSGVTPAACNPNDDDDVWFSFVAVATAHTITVSSPVGFTGVVIDARSGACQGTSIGCVATGGGATLPLTSLTIGATYFVRVYSGGLNVGTFNICVTHLVLPLELKSFTGEVKGNTNVLNWETATEKNVQFHSVERSIDGATWQEIGRKNGLANSAVSVKYVLEDRSPIAKAYYRLRSVDFDGQENISNTIALSRKGDQSGITSVFPSPTKNNVTVQFNATREEKVMVQVMDMTGRLVLEQTREVIAGSNDLLLTLNALQAGVYTVKVSNSAGVSAPVRFVKE